MLLRFCVIVTLALSSLHAANQFEQSITPSKVYTKLAQLHNEIHLIKKHFAITQEPQYIQMKTQLLPRHAWQRTYEIFVKINILREKYDLPIIEPVNMEPTLDLKPSFTYEQILRLLQEVQILKLRFGINTPIEAVAESTNKTPTDVYNMLNKISRDFDIINGKEITPNYVFSESIRIYEDFQAIFTQLNLSDQSTPPNKKNRTTPKDSYESALQLLQNIKQIEQEMGLKTLDTYAFKRQKVNPSDVFEITQILLAELQVIKAKIGLIHTITRGAKKYHDKTPADVNQMLQWLLKKSQILLLSQTTR